MQLVYPYFKLIKQDKILNKKTDIYEIYSLGGVYLGILKWHASFRKYSFFPVNDTVFDNKCLTDIIHALYTLNKEHKENK